MDVSDHGFKHMYYVFRVDVIVHLMNYDQFTLFTFDLAWNWFIYYHFVIAQTASKDPEAADSSEDEDMDDSKAPDVTVVDPMLQVAKNDRVFIHHDKQAGQHILVRPYDFNTVVIPKIQDPELHMLAPDADGKVQVIVDSISKDPNTKSKYASTLLSRSKATHATGEIYQRCLEYLWFFLA